MKYDLDLWLKAEATSVPDRNWVYNISMTMARDMRSSYNILTINTSQSSPSQPSLAIEELVGQWVGALRVEMEEMYEAKKREKRIDYAYLCGHYPPPIYIYIWFLHYIKFILQFKLVVWCFLMPLWNCFIAF